MRRVSLAVALLAVFAACAGNPRDDRAVTAAGAGVEQLGATTTTAAPPASVAPTTTSPAPTTTVAAPPSTYPRPSIPPIPTTTINTTPAPPVIVTGRTTAQKETATTTSGDTTLSVTVSPLDQKPGQPVTIDVDLTSPDHATVRIYTGDGEVIVVPNALGATCPAPPYAVPIKDQTYTYRAAGTYVIRVVAALYPCPADSPNRLPNVFAAPTTVEAAVNYQQR